MTEFSIVCAWKDLGDRDRRRSYEWTRDYWRSTFDAEIVEGSPEPFTRARGLNDAIRRASCDVILQADPDSVVPAAQALAAVRLAEAEDGLVVPYDTYLYLGRDATARLQAGAALREFGPADCESFGSGGAGPATCFSRRTWELARGYDERFGLWGGDDAAFAFACEAFTGRTWRRVAGPVVHSWHRRLPASVPGTRAYRDGFALLAEYRNAEARGPAAVRELVGSRS